MTKLNSTLRSWDITLSTKVHIVKAMVFPVIMYGCESWTIKKAESQRIDAFKLWCWRRWVQGAGFLGHKVIKPVNLKGNQLWILIGRTDAEAEAPVFWSFDANSWLIGKVIDAEKDWRQKVKRASEYEMAGWHHRCNGHELGQWTWNFMRWWGTERPVVLQFMVLQRVRHDWATEQQADGKSEHWNLRNQWTKTDGNGKI